MCGLALTATFPRPAVYPLCFVALAPLLAATRRTTGTRTFALGWVAGLAYYLTTWRWMLPTIAGLQGISILAALPFFALFTAYHAVQLGLFALFAQCAFSRGQEPITRGPRAVKLPSPMGIAACWVLLEYAFPRVIPWYLADPIAASPTFRQLADVGGIYGVSFLLVLVNALVANAAISPMPARLRSAAAALVLVTGAGVYGQLRIAEWSPLAVSSKRTPDGAAIRVAVTQGDLPPAHSVDGSANLNAWRVYESLTRESLDRTISESNTRSLVSKEGRPGKTSGVDLLVWPETTLRSYLREDGDLLNRADELVRRINTPLLTGALDRHVDGIHELNSAYLFVPGEPVPPPRERIYHKRRLLWFGERSPATLDWRTTGRFMPASQDDPVTLRLPVESRVPAEITFSPSICFEAVFPGAFNDAVRKGAMFLVNVTDDGWFGDTDEPYQHLNATVLRAVETRRWLVRASNSGISAFVDPTGEIVTSLPFGTRGVVTHSIQPSDEIPLYVHLGNWPVGVSFLLVASSVWIKRLRKGFGNSATSLNVLGWQDTA